MELLPESIQSTQTLALDHTFRERLLSLAVDQLAIAPEQERDLRKLTLYLRQFGIPVELFPDLCAIQLRDLLPPERYPALDRTVGRSARGDFGHSGSRCFPVGSCPPGAPRRSPPLRCRSPAPLFLYRCKGGGHKRGRMADLYSRFSSPLPGFSTRERAFATFGAASRQPIVLNRTEAFTIASARIADTGISFGAWCGLWLTNRT